MTIITKPITDKKSDKLDVPLVENEHVQELPTKVDVESPPQYLILRNPRVRRMSASATVCLFLTALLVMSVGIIGGVYLYHKVAKSQAQHYRGWCKIPYDGTKPFAEQSYQTQQLDSGFADSNMFKRVSNSGDVDDMDMDDLDHDPNYFNEKFEIDLESEKYEKVDVPDFKNGRRGRFIHDFNANTTGIIDLEAQRCFVMPLNRNRVLPPKSLFDLIRKMWDGYYEVNTDVVRETMRVVTPPLSNLEDTGMYISQECKGFPTYRLEKYVPGVFKRSIEETAKYAVFSGNNIVEFDIVFP